MGFRATERNLKRAGCDYWDDVEIVRWACADEFFAAHASGALGDGRLYLFTGQAQLHFAEVTYGSDDFLIFGRESRGLDQACPRRG